MERITVDLKEKHWELLQDMIMRNSDMTLSETIGRALELASWPRRKMGRTIDIEVSWKPENSQRRGVAVNLFFHLVVAQRIET
jgi:hypothetical protein